MYAYYSLDSTESLTTEYFVAHADLLPETFLILNVLKAVNARHAHQSIFVLI